MVSSSSRFEPPTSQHYTGARHRECSSAVSILAASAYDRASKDTCIAVVLVDLRHSSADKSVTEDELEKLLEGRGSFYPSLRFGMRPRLAPAYGEQSSAACKHKTENLRLRDHLERW